jgi:hypothetical protein
LATTLVEEVRSLWKKSIHGPSTSSHARSWIIEETVLRHGAGCDSKNGVHALFYAPSIQRYLLSRDPERAEDFERHRRSARRLAAEEPVPA